MISKSLPLPTSCLVSKLRAETFVFTLLVGGFVLEPVNFFLLLLLLVLQALYPG